VARILVETNATTVLVTHDQNEALAFADRIAVLQRGVMVVSADPHELYRHPPDVTAATSLGEANILAAEVAENWAHCALGAVRVHSHGPVFDGPAQLLLRPEQLVVISNVGMTRWARSSWIPNSTVTTPWSTWCSTIPSTRRCWRASPEISCSAGANGCGWRSWPGRVLSIDQGPEGESTGGPRSGMMSGWSRLGPTPPLADDVNADRVGTRVRRSHAPYLPGPGENGVGVVAYGLCGHRGGAGRRPARPRDRPSPQGALPHPGGGWGALAVALVLFGFVRQRAGDRAIRAGGYVHVSSQWLLVLTAYMVVLMVGTIAVLFIHP